MEKPALGSIVRAPVRFSDLSGSKPRPALVVADLPGDDILICQITKKQPQNKGPFMELSAAECDGAPLPITCYLRPLRLFTISVAVLHGVVTKVKAHVLAWAKDEIRKTM